jgi:hypothetical protein
MTADFSMVHYVDIEMTAGQPMCGKAFGNGQPPQEQQQQQLEAGAGHAPSFNFDPKAQQVVPNQVLSAVGGGAAGGGAGGNAPFLGTDMPASLLPPAAAAGGGAGGHAPPLLLPPAGVVAAAGSSSSTNSRSFYDNLFLRMKKARISQGSIQ